MEDILECPRCSSREIALVPNDLAKFFYKCKKCSYQGEKIKRIDKIEEERKRILSMTLSRKTKKEIEDALRRKKAQKNDILL